MRNSSRATCDSCEALMVNGLYCHETGCPRFESEKRKRVSEEECDHSWLYVGGHNEWWVCTKCGTQERR